MFRSASFLSSGIDSTALTALASRERAGLHTFTLFFPEREFSEAEMARRTARHFGTDHTEVMIGGDEMLARMDEAIAAFDSPSVDGINTFFVSWAARQAGLKVALSGLGSDEIFGGYSEFRVTPQLARLARVALATPAALRNALAPAVDFFGKRISHEDGARKLVAAWTTPDALPDAYFLARALFTPPRATELLGSDAATWSRAPAGRWLEETARQAGSLHGEARISWLELRNYMASTLLRDVDAMSMSHSLEVRVPFLDHPLVESALRAADSGWSNGSKRPKALLIAALRDLLPTEVAEQRKRTFTLPWEEWMRGALRGASGGGIRRMVAAARGACSRSSGARSLGCISCWAHKLVAAVGALRAERMGEAQSREQRRSSADFQSNIRNPRSDVTARRSL